MIDRIAYRYHGTRYLFVEATAFRRSRWPGDASLRYVSRLEARWVVEAIARKESALLDRLCRELDGTGHAVHGYAQRRPTGEDPRVERMLRGLGLASLGTEGDGAPAFARVYLLREPDASSPPLVPESAETVAIDRALAKLEAPELVFRGHRYRFVRSSRIATVRDRDGYETMRESEMWSVLRACGGADSAPQAHKVALAELLAIAEAQHAKCGRTELLLLRRVRLHAAPPVDGLAMTPSQLRAARQRDWTAVEAVDRDELPVAGIRLEFVLPDGGMTTLTTDAEGVARLASVAPGSVTIRVLELDGESWRAVGGAPAAASSQQAPARTHVMRDGECLTKIAARYGFKGWQTLWEHPQNEGLRKRRSTPHVLAPGDVVAIPRVTVHEIVRETGAVHRVEVARGSALVRLRLQDLAGNPLAGLAYHYSFRTEERDVRRPGSKATDADGWLEETVPLFVQQLEVDVRLPKLRFVYDLRRLHPARDRDTDTPIGSGIARRLQRLGYAEQGDTARAGNVTLFQALQLRRNDAKGDPDRPTLDALEGAYSV